MSKEELSDDKEFEIWDKLAEATDHLYYYHNGLHAQSTSLNKYREWVVGMRADDLEVVRQLEKKLIVFMRNRHTATEEMDVKLEEILKRLSERIKSTPNKIKKNPGYAGYMDMMLRYQDLRKQLDRLTPMVKNSPMWIEDLVRDHSLMSQMNEKMDELVYRCQLVDVSRTVSKRAIQDDPLTALFDLPSYLVGFIFDSKTSTKRASKLLRLCKRSLALAEAVQYERDNTNHPVVTMSGVLKNPPQKKSVPSLYSCIPSPDSAGSTRSLIAPENGEVSAPTAPSLPIAKDSSTTVGNKEPLVPVPSNPEGVKKNPPQ